LRKKIIDQLLDVGREQSALTVMFHSAIGARLGLSATEHKALDIIMRAGPVTAGRLAELTGLTTGAVTGLIDRFEKAGFVRRVRDPNDRRKVMIEMKYGKQIDQMYKRVTPLFEAFGQALHELYDQYTDEELELILDFQKKGNDLLQKQITNLRSK
jgi:DNA-binding MarR family transcriptional regulator